MKRVSVFGAGGWGMAIANLLVGEGNDVTLWVHAPTTPRSLVETREDKSKLPGVLLHPDITITEIVGEALDGVEVVFMAIPTQHVRAVCRELKVTGLPIRVMVSLSKGIEVGSLKRVSELFGELLGEKCRDSTVVVSGPSHAEEVARQIPTSVVAAGVKSDFVIEIQRLLSTKTFRVYASDDLVGVELGGALKNVIAVAAGMLYGLKLGDNTMGALLTRGLAEITRLGVKMGARAETFAGLSGLGDMVTTCNSRHSRNRAVGERIGQGEKLREILASMTMVAEGVETTRAAVRLADTYHVDMPISRQVYQVLFEDKPPLEGLNELMCRELKKEVYS